MSALQSSPSPRRRTRHRAAQCLCALLIGGWVHGALAAETATPTPTATPAAASAAAEAHQSPTAPSTTPPGGKDAGTPQAADGAGPAKGLAALEFRTERPLDFGKATLGSASPARTVTLLASPGTTATESYAIRVLGDFKATPASCDMAAKGACAISVTFAPTKPGASTGAIVVADVQGGPTRVAADLQGWGQAACEAQGLNACEGWHALWPVFLLTSIFMVAMMFVRWNMVAVPAREQLRAEIETVRTRSPAPPPNPAAAAAGRADESVVDSLLERAGHRLQMGSGWEWLMNVVFWSRGREHMGFQLLHEAKHVLVGQSPPAILRVELEVAEGRLRARNQPAALALANSIRTELDRTLVDLHDPAGAALRETLAYLKRTAGDAIAGVAAANAPDSKATAAEMAALAKRLLAALNEEQRSALSLAVNAALQAPAADMPPEHRSLLNHTRGVLLVSAREAGVALQAVTNLPAPDADKWHQGMAAFSQQYLSVAEALRVRIEAALGATVAPPPERWRALAREANHHLYDVEDAEFAWTASWHKKTLWLTFLGLLLICALAATFAHTTFFLLGALGGLLSRMQRMLTRDTVPVDYGQSWVTLFLSPVVGALAGWAGVLLVAVAVDWGLLGALFSKVQWDQPFHVLTMGMALLFGISERLLMSVVEGLEGKANVGPDAGGAAKGADAASAGDAKPKTLERGAATAAPATPAATAATAQGLEITNASTLPKCKVGSEFSQQFTAAGGAPALRWTVARGPLPKGLTLDDKGVLKGQPLQLDNAPFTLAVSDSAGAHHEREFTLQVTK